MSTIGTIMDAAVTVILAAIPAVTAGNAERSQRQGLTLNPSELPHLFVHGADDAVSPLDYGQEQRELSFVADLWRNDQTQEQMLVDMELVKVGLLADVTLGGNVERAWLSLTLIEMPDRDMKVGRFTFESIRIE